jgi:hypothetical protein
MGLRAPRGGRTGPDRGRVDRLLKACSRPVRSPGPPKAGLPGVGHFLVPARGLERWSARREVEAFQDGARRIGRVDHRKEPRAGSTARALEHVDCEDPAEQVGPGEAPGSRRGLGGRGLLVGRALPSRATPHVVASRQRLASERGFGPASRSEHSVIARPEPTPHPLLVARHGKARSLRRVRRPAGQLVTGHHATHIPAGKLTLRGLSDLDRPLLCPLPMPLGPPVTGVVTP